MTTKLTIITAFFAGLWIGGVIGLIALMPLGERTYLLAIPVSVLITFGWVGVVNLVSSTAATPDPTRRKDVP